MAADTVSIVAYVVGGLYLAAVAGVGMVGAALTLRRGRASGKKTHEHYMAGGGLATLVWFFTMSASLFSGYTVSGIVAEAYNQGWIATRWIPGGVGVYMGFLFMAPRLHALGKSRRYVTISEFLFDRYSSPSGAPWVPHALRIVSFLALQLPIFTYLITQFQAVGTEVRTFTSGAISSTAAVLACAGILLVCDLLGGMRAVAYTDVLQGVVLLIGSVIFLVIQRTELGGLPAAAAFYRDPANAAAPNVALMQKIPPASSIVAYWDFCFKTAIAATMFPHLCQRMFAARDAAVMRRGLATMNFSFFIIQLSSMITGWVAIAVLKGPLPKGTSVFSSLLLTVASKGTGQAILSALLLASAVCAMMSTADSALLSFSSMWVRDLFVPYIRPRASENTQIWFGRVMSIIGLAIGVSLGLLTIEKGKPNLTGLFSLQNVTPIHIAPAVWLGLHWRGLRGEAVVAGMVSGLAVTIGLVFSPVNVMLARGLDQTACGLSTAMIGCFVNVTVTVALGLLMQRRPGALGAAFAAVRDALPAPGHVDIGTARDALLSKPFVWLWVPMVLALLFCTPFYLPPLSPAAFVGDMAAWAFVALLLSGALACLVAGAYTWLWSDWEEGGSRLPSASGMGMPAPACKGSESELAAAAAAFGGGAVASKDAAVM